MNNLKPLSEEAKRAAIDLSASWDSGAIDPIFAFQVTRNFDRDGAAVSEHIFVKYGVKSSEFSVPPLRLLYELQDTHLLEIVERGNNIYEVRLTSTLRDVAKSEVEMAANTKSHLFISYSRQDKLLRRLIQEKLSADYPTIWSDDEFLGSEKWWEEILSEISKTDVFIYLISKDAVNSLYCRAELSEAIRLQKQILPVIIRETSYIPSQVMDHQKIDVYDADGIDNVINTLKLGVETALNHAKDDDPLWTHQPFVPNKLHRTSIPANIDPQDAENSLNMGIYLIEGDKVEISATGTITFDEIERKKIQPFGDTAINPGRFFSHPEIYPTRDQYRMGELMSGRVGSLIGWIGEGNYQEDAFLVGSNASFEVQEGDEGFLYLAVNDARGTYGDNNGCFNIRIKVSRD